MLELDESGAAISTHAAGVVSLKQGVGGSVKLSANGLVATSFVSKLELAAAGATLTGGPASKVSVTAAKIDAGVAPGAGMTLNAAGARIFSSGANVNVFGPTLTVNAALIKIG